VSDVTAAGFVLAGAHLRLDQVHGAGLGRRRHRARLSGNAGVVTKCKVSDAAGTGPTIAATCIGSYVFKARILRPGVDGIVNDGGGGVVAGSRVVDAVGRGILDNCPPRRSTSTPTSIATS
jgi:hypothetical protein